MMKLMQNGLGVNTHVPTLVDHKTYYSRIRESDIRQVTIDLGIKITGESNGLINCDCPRHSSASHKSFHITPSTQTWFCFGCQVGGDVIQLVEFHQSGIVTKNVRGEMPETHRKARDWLGVRQGLPPLSQLSMTPEQVEQLRTRYQEEERLYGCLTALCEFYHQKLVEDPEVLSQFQANYAISLETITTLKIGYSIVAGAARHLYDNGYTYDDMIECGAFKSNYQDKPVPRFKFRYTFPYWNNGRVIYLAGRETSKTPKPERTSSENEHHSKYYKLPTRNDDPKGNRQAISPIISNRILWNEHILDTNPPFVIISEGMTDAISAHDRGFPVISPITTYIANDDQERIIKKLRRLKCPVYICLDNEPSKVGNEAATKMAELFEFHGIEPPRIVTLTLTDDQIAAKELIAEMFDVTDDMTKKQVKEIEDRLLETDRKEFKRLADAAKQDINSYFKSGFTADDFRTLLSEAPTCRGLVIQKRRERIIAKDFSVLEDKEFLRAMAEAKTKDIATYAEISELIKKNKGWGVHIKDGIKTLKDDPRHSSFIKKQEKKEVAKALEEIGVSCPEGCGLCTVPIGYEFTDHGIDWVKKTQNQVQRELVSDRPVLVLKQAEDILGNNEHLLVSWLQNERWRTRWFPREKLVDTRKIIEATAPFGFPVHSENAKRVSKFIYDFVTTNEKFIPKEKQSERLGWHSHGFLWGNQFISKGSAVEPVNFQGADKGDIQTAEVMTSQGSLKEWQNVIDTVKHYPYPRVIFGTVFAAPLLKILDTNSFMLDLAGKTSIGKTITTKAAIAAFGNPEKNGIFDSWNTTPVAAERRCALLNGIPVVFDDSKELKDPRIADAVIYSVINGFTKSRGSKKGQAASQTFKSAYISTGESRITELSGSFHAGRNVRVITLQGRPYNGSQDDTLPIVNALEEVAKTNYGHAGPKFVQWLLDNEDRWAEFRTRHKERARAYLTTITGEAARVADSCAAIAIALELAMEAGCLTAGWNDPFIKLWPEIESALTEEELGKRSLFAIYEWVNTNSIYFFGQPNHDEKRPWYGKWEDPWTHIDIMPQTLKTALRSLGHDPDGVIQEWRDRGWLDVGTGRKIDRQIRCKHKQVWVISLRKQALIENGVLPRDHATEKSTTKDGGNVVHINREQDRVLAETDDEHSSEALTGNWDF